MCFFFRFLLLCTNWCFFSSFLSFFFFTNWIHNCLHNIFILSITRFMDFGFNIYKIIIIFRFSAIYDDKRFNFFFSLETVISLFTCTRTQVHICTKWKIKNRWFCHKFALNFQLCWTKIFFFCVFCYLIVKRFLSPLFAVYFRLFSSVFIWRKSTISNVVSLLNYAVKSI